MTRYIIQGGIPLSGEIKLSGAKNAALKMMAASILTSDISVLKNVPSIKDVDTMIQVLEFLGVSASFNPDGDLHIDAAGDLSDKAPYELVSQMRASIIVLGPLLARLGRAHVALPGGCNIGSRQIDLHLGGLKALGAKITTGHGYIEGECSDLKGTIVTLDFPSVGATENLLMAAVLAKGTTVIENAAREPEVTDLVLFLNKMGGRISGEDTAVLTIEGVDSLHGAVHEIMPDRIEAGTMLIAAAMTNGSIQVDPGHAEHLGIVLEKLSLTGADLSVANSTIRLTTKGRPAALDVSTLPYPGFPTDLQPMIAAYLSCAEGISILTENVFENRFMYIDELNRMGADIRLDGHHAIIKGVKSLSGAPVRAPDLRAGAALILAGLGAEGETIVEDVGHIERGYEGLEEKLRYLGADIIKES